MRPDARKLTTVMAPPPSALEPRCLCCSRPRSAHAGGLCPRGLGVWTVVLDFDRESAAAERALASRVREVLADLDTTGLSRDEQRVLWAIVRGAARGQLRGARRLCDETGLEMRELERACDALLARGLIGTRSEGG